MSNLWTLKKAADALEFGAISPLSNFEQKGGSWQSFGAGYGFKEGLDEDERRYNSLKLENRFVGKSDAVTLTVADGWTADFLLYSENDEFFSDNVKNAIEAEAQIKRELLYDESLRITLSGGDYLSVDIDEEHDGIFRFRLRKNGVFYNIEDPENPNNEFFISMANASFSEAESIYPHTMYDCATETAYTANDEAEHNRLAALGYVHSLDECDSGVRRCATGFTWNPSTQSCEPDNNGGGGGGEDEDEDEDEGSPILGFLLLGLVAFGLWWLFTKPDSVKTDSSTFTKSPPNTGGLGDA